MSYFRSQRLYLGLLVGATVFSYFVINNNPAACFFGVAAFICLFCFQQAEQTDSRFNDAHRAIDELDMRTSNRLDSLEAKIEEKKTR